MVMKHEISGEGRKLGLQVVYGEEEDEGNLGNSPSFKKKMKKGGKNTLSRVEPLSSTCKQSALTTMLHRIR